MLSNSQLQLQQFERNRYFYGKLLSVKDFQLEQNYYIEKRSLLNRFVHGTGVIGGLHLSQIDGTGVRLTPGTAIDAAGREIVVAANLDVADISKLAGYPSNYPPAKDDIIYAVISYDEIAREPVPPVSNATASTDGIELNKIRETFKFSLTKETPAAAGSLESAYRETVTAFENDQFIVQRSVPRVANPGDVIEVVLTVRTKLQQGGTALVEIAESLPSQLTMLSAWKANKIPFNLGGLAGGVTRTQRYYARAGEMPTSGVINGQLLFNSVLQSATSDSSVAIVADRSIVRLLAERYFAEQPDTGSSDHIVLAAITINNKGIITGIDESVRPFIYNNELLFQLMLADKQRPAQLPTHAASHADGGADELNVTNLSGVLAEAQKVAVHDNGVPLTNVRSKINFTGLGVTVSDDSQKEWTTVNIPGMKKHAGDHADGGADELNVNNLSGTLADPQKVTVQKDGTAYPAYTKINFIGAGVTAAEDSKNGRINVTISSAAATHAGTHADGGSDELNVNNLSGKLADPQKVTVQKDGTAYPAYSNINFTGTGVSVTDDASNGRVNVNITGGSQTAGAQIATGSILFQSMYPGEVRVSPFISHPLPSTNIGIILSVVHSIGLDGLPDESISGGLQTSLLPNKLIAGEALSATSLASTTDQTTQLSQTPGNQTPPIIPIPDIPIIPGLTSTVKAGDAAFIEADLPYVMAQYPTTTNIGFQVKIQDKRNNDGFEQTKDWTVRWWAVIGTVDTGTVTVPAYGGQTSLTGGSKLEDTSGVKLPETDTPVIKVPIDDTPIIKLPIDDTPIIKLPTDDTPIIKVPIDGTPIIRQPIEQVELMSALRTTDSSIDAAALNVESVAESEAIEAKLADIVVEPVKKTRRSSKASAQPIESASDTSDKSES